MKKVVLILILVLILMFSLAYGEKIGVLTDVLRPESIEVSRERLYVVEGATFYIYALENLEPIGKFGKKGEGPGELTVMPMFSNRIQALHDKLFAEGRSKVIFFSKEGKRLKEIRKKEGFRTYQLMPIGKNYTAVRMLSSTGTDKKYYLGLFLLDAEMNVIKELYKQEFPEKEKDIVMVTDSPHYAVYKDRIYVEESEKGFVIEVFGSSGDKLYEIKKEVEVRKITGKDKEAIFRNFKEDNFIQLMAKSKGGWESFKKTINFIYPDTFPAIQDIIVTDDKIYVSTYETTDNKVKFVVMDLKGNILSTPYLPKPMESSFVGKTLGRDNRYYGIANNKFYYLIENDDDEEWELHAVGIQH